MMTKQLEISGVRLKRGDILIKPKLGCIKQIHGRTNSYLIDVEGSDERHRIDHDAQVTIKRPNAPRRKSAPVTATTRSTESADKFATRAALIAKIHDAEFEFTRKPNHLNAATLAALRAAICQVELEIVDLNLRDRDDA
jgi:hypothetical protein